MKKIFSIMIIGIFFAGNFHYKESYHENDWTVNARIAAEYFFGEEEVYSRIDIAYNEGVSVLLTWISTENIGVSEEDVEFLEKITSYTHKNYPEMKIVVYQAPLEVITPNVDKNKDGILDKGKESIFSQHPDWLQVSISGKKAVFYGNVEFWVGEYDEDAWLCPNNPEYKNIVLENVRKIASTGVDGIWIDVVKFLNDYGGWQDEWACHCKYCKELFKREKGFDLPKIVDWENRTWKEWILWRQEKINKFIRDIGNEAKKINPEIKIIVEHWHGFDVEATREAFSPIGLVGVTDVLVHEYDAATYNPSLYDTYNLLRDVALLKFYRGIDKSNGTWVLSYSQEVEGQRLLAALVLEAQGNFYDTDYPEMDGSVDREMRSKIFHWIQKYEEYYYDVEPFSNVAIFYSKATLDFVDSKEYGEGEFYREFLGISMMLLQLHIPYEVIFDLENAKDFDLVILPNTSCISEGEIEKIKSFLENGGKIVATGKTFLQDEWGEERKDIPFKKGFNKVGSGFMFYTSTLYGNKYYERVKPYHWKYEERESVEDILKEFLTVFEKMEIPKIFETDASEKVVILPSKKENKVIFRILNLEGIEPRNASPEKQIFSISVNFDVKNVKKIDFLKDSEILEKKRKINLEVKDHTLLIVEKNTVQILTNQNDFLSAKILSEFLKENGFETKLVSAKDFDRNSEKILILGGHKAEEVGDIVSKLLNKKEKEFLEKEGASYIFLKNNLWRKDQKIVIVAGNTRLDTKRAAEERKYEILDFFKNQYIRGAQLELDIFEEKSVGEVFEELKDAGVNTVFLRVFSYDGGVYFKTDLAPVERDLLSEVIYEAKKYDIKVYAWMTTLNMEWILEEHPDWAVVGYDYEKKKFEKNMSFQKRVSPFVPEHREYLKALYSDLASYEIEGVMFQDDLYMTEYEDYSKFAKNAYEREFGKELKPENMIVDGEYTEEFWNWSKWKAEELMKLAKEIMDEMRKGNPNLKFVLDTYYESVYSPKDSLAWHSQDVFLAKNYGFDFAAVMSYHREIAKWENIPIKESLKRLEETTEIGVKLLGKEFLIMKIQVVDFDTSEVLPYEEIDAAFSAVVSGGGTNFLYYPHTSNLPLEILKKYLIS